MDGQAGINLVFFENQAYIIEGRFDSKPVSISIVSK